MEDSGGFRCVWDQRVVLLLKLLYTFLKEFVLFSQMGTQRNGFKRGGSSFSPWELHLMSFPPEATWARAVPAAGQTRTQISLLSFPFLRQCAMISSPQGWDMKWAASTTRCNPPPARLSITHNAALRSSDTRVSPNQQVSHLRVVFLRLSAPHTHSIYSSHMPNAFVLDVLQQHSTAFDFGILGRSGAVTRVQRVRSGSEGKTSR